MNKKILQAFFVLFTAALMYGQGLNAQNVKRGLAMSTNTSTGIWHENVANTNSSWYYTWGVTIPVDQQTNTPENSEFVPMFWGAGSITPSSINELIKLKDQGEISYILGFNEPDLNDQANMTVEQALGLWPQLESIGLPLVSPATSYPRTSDGSWFRGFMDGAIAQNLRIDYIAVHMYAGYDPDHYMTVLQEVWDRYHIPIWITEFAVRDDNTGGDPEKNQYTPKMILSFMKNLLPRLENSDFVYRYSWFSPSPSMAGLWPCALFNQDGSLTILGGYYKSLDSTLRVEDTPPILTYNSPLNNSMITGDKIIVNATAFDIDHGTNDGDGIDSVVFELLQDGKVLASTKDEKAPYTWSPDISKQKAGVYTLRATVCSTFDSVFTSSNVPRTITINAANTNLSLNKTSTASTAESWNPASDGNDGSISTRWAASGPEMPQWFKVDLGAVYNLSFADIYWYMGDSRSYKYIIEVSGNGVSYQTIVDKSTNTIRYVKSTDNLNVNGRFVRVTTLGSSTGWASIYDVQIFGTQSIGIANTTPDSDCFFHMYPNPAINGRTTIQLKGNPPGVRLEVTDLSGRIIRQKSFSENTTGLADLRSGIYIVKVFNEAGAEVKILVAK